MKSKKIIKYLLIAVVVLIIISFIGKRQGWFGQGYVCKVVVDSVKLRTITEYITADGKVEPEEELKISSDVSGEIVELNVEEGDEVNRGDLLVVIKPDIYISAVERMEASLNTTKANFANAQARLEQANAQFEQKKLAYERQKKLWGKNIISQAEYENALSAYQIAEAELKSAQENVRSAEYSVKSAEAALKEARENLKKTKIYAPASGTVSKLNVKKGERVVGTIQMTGTEILRIADLDNMQVKVQVNENDVVRIAEGDTGLISIDAYPDHDFKGIVTQIANSANTQQLSSDQVTNYDVEIKILKQSYEKLLEKLDSMGKKKAHPLLPGMTASVEIQTQTVYNVLSVPIQSVATKIDTTNKFEPDKQRNKKQELKEIVFIYNNENKTVAEREVKTGIQDDKYIQIIKGLKLNELVVSAPYRAITKILKDGLKVKKVNKKELYKE